MEPGDESIDPLYLVPTHLREPQSIGPIPVRTFYVVLAVGMLAGAPLAVVARNHLGDGGLWLELLPIALGTPFALPWLDPPAEHGLIQACGACTRLLCRRTTLGVRQQPDLALHGADRPALGLAAAVDGQLDGLSAAEDRGQV
jgi:hypothetical protein